MTNKERLDLSNEQIERITKTLAKKQVSPTDMLQQLVDQTQSLASMFANPKIVNLDLSNLDTSEVTTMQKAFQSNTEIKNIIGLNKLNTSNVTDMSYMFNRCSNLDELDLSSFDTSNVNTMREMFSSCHSITQLDLSSFNTEKVTSMQNMFAYCKKLVDLNISKFNTSNVQYMTSMFYECNELPQLDFSGFDTNKTEYTNGMFYRCYKLHTINNLNLISVTNTNSMFYDCTKLTNLILRNIKCNLQLGSSISYGHLLTDESIINTFKELWDLTGQTSQKLTLSLTSNSRTEQIYVKLVDVTDEMLAQDQYAGNKKPCVVCESTDEGAMTLKEYGISKNWSIA